MGTNLGRAAKIDWMRLMRPKIMDENLLLRTFCVRFSSTMFTAKEILGIVKDQKLIDQRKLK